MPVPRPLTTYLLLAALLISNVAGWLHVGCCDPAEHKVAIGRAVAIDAEPHSCCCHHECDSTVGTEGDSTGHEPEHVPEHDSDSCSVCQSFFASRDAILGPGESAVWVPLRTVRLRLDRDEVSTESVFLSGLSVRGPPNA